MAKSKFKIEALVLSMFLAVQMMSPLSVNAQGVRSDDYFRSEFDVNESRDVDWLLFGIITNDSFGAPLDSGLLVLTAAGAVYLLQKRKKRIIVVSIALILGFVQCKKKVDDVIPYDIKGMNITLNVDGGVKTNVNPQTGVVTFEEGDELVVANNGVYVGKLYYQDGRFSGTISATNTNDYLHFYSLGNNITSTLTLGRSLACNVSIANQAADLPLISYGHSTAKFSEDITSYSARLENQCALVKFNVTNSSPYAGACITGMNNTVFVSFEYKTFTCSSEDGGNITLPSGSGERWAILLPQSEVSEGSAFAGLYTGTCGRVPEIHADDYLTDGIPVVIETPTTPTAVKTGFFTVNGEGRQVRFAKGSIYYDKAYNKWQLMLDQHRRLVMGDYTPGVDNSDVVRVEYHGWGTSGFDHGAVNYHTRYASANNSDYYAYGDATKNLYDENGYADWGCNKLSNAEVSYRQWRTITAEELAYIMEYRENAAEKYALATLSISSSMCYCGLMVLPDDWVEPYENCFTPGIANGFMQNEYNSTQWKQMSAAGVLFLPCGGMCNGGEVHGICSYGCYWTSSAYDPDHAYSLYFSETEVDWRHVTERHMGLLVRLLME